VTPQDLIEFIELLGAAPEGDLEPYLSAKCKNFSGADPVNFLRNLRDVAVHVAGGSSFVILAISSILDSEYPETTEACVKRRTALEAQKLDPYASA
jgi:hypothetical protein